MRKIGKENEKTNETLKQMGERRMEDKEELNKIFESVNDNRCV